MDVNRFIAEKVFGLKEGKDFGSIYLDAEIRLDVEVTEYNSSEGYETLLNEISYKYLVVTSVYHGNTLCVILNPNTNERLAHAVERTHFEVLASAVVKLFS